MNTENTHNTNTSNGKKVSVEQLENKEVWVCWYENDDNIVTVNADGAEIERGIASYIGGGRTTTADTLEEIKTYAENNPDLIDGIGIYESTEGLWTGKTAKDAVESYNQEKLQKAQKREQIKSELDLDPQKIRLLEDNKLLIDFHESGESYFEFAKRKESLQPALSVEEQREIEYDQDDELYVGLPSDLRVVRHNGKYCTFTETDEGRQYDEITNFVINVNAFLRSDNEVKMDVDVVPSSPFEDSYNVIIGTDVFSETRKFKEELCKGQTTTYKGSARELTDIKQLVGHQQAPERTGIDTVGLHDGEMVTPEGVIDGEWEVEDPTHKFEPKEQAVENKWSLPIEGNGEFNEEEVANIVRTLWQTRDSERFLPILGYWYSSLLAPKIREIEGELPMATVMADTGAGKTSTLGILYRILGMDGNPYSARDTKYALLNALASTNNVPIWLDEYKPSDMRSYEVDTLQDYLRKTTRRGDETRGNADQTVTTYTLESPVILSGEESIQGSAEERRAIRTQFRTAVTDEESEYAQHWAKLNGGSYQDENGVNYCDGYDLEEHAKGVWQFILGVDEFETRWRDAKEQVYDTLEEAGIVGISDLELTALTMIQVGCDLYNEFGQENGVEESELPSEEDIDEAIIYIAQKMGQANRTSHVDEFVKLLADAIEAGYLREEDDYENESGDYTIVHEGKHNEQLRVKLNKAHHAVSKYINDHDLGGIDLLDSPNDYRKRMQDDVPYINEISIPTQGLGRCISIKTHEAETTVDNFQRGQINPEVYYTTENE